MEETRNPDPTNPNEAQNAASPPAEAQPPSGTIGIDDLLKPQDGEGSGASASDPDLARAASILESLLLVSTEPIGIEKAGMLLGGLSKAQVRKVHEILRAKYPPDSSGILVEEVAKGYQFRTNPANQEHVRRLFDTKPPRFSRAALETLAIIAYKQPLTRQEIEQIRGVDCAGSLKTLMERRLVKVTGKKDVPGKPFLFGTTREFMETFSLASLSELPSMREIEDFLAASTGTLLEGGRPGIPGMTWPEGGVEESGGELVESLSEAGSPAPGEEPQGETIPADVTEAELIDAASREAGEGGESPDGQ